MLNDTQKRTPISREVNQATPAVKIQLDWKAYFMAFQEAHGGNPVVHRGRLLFNDGWTYSQSDYAGPEWPPPEESSERKALLRFYWLRSKQIAAYQCRELKYQIASLTEMQRARPTVPLMQKVTGFDENGRLLQETHEIDLEDLAGRLEFLEGRVDECNRELSVLESR